ncbi:MAG: hypothetical protein AB1513_01410 [Pseudomonadota bacterium]
MFASVPAHAAESYDVPPEFWYRPRSGEAVLAQPAIRQAVNALAHAPRLSLVIHHGADAETQLWAAELRGWLGALALDAARIRLVADAPGGEQISLEVRE